MVLEAESTDGDAVTAEKIDSAILTIDNVSIPLVFQNRQSSNKAIIGSVFLFHP